MIPWSSKAGVRGIVYKDDLNSDPAWLIGVIDWDREGQPIVQMSKFPPGRWREAFDFCYESVWSYRLAKFAM